MSEACSTRGEFDEYIFFSFSLELLQQIYTNFVVNLENLAKKYGTL
jgi:hypothetical protein